MLHETSFIATIVVGLVLAFVFGALANRLKISLLVGYLAAGVVVGPFTPGFVADQKLAAHLAEIGVILLMFGVGLHFSPKDLLAVRLIAVPGAILQTAVSTGLGMGIGWLLGWTPGASFMFGLALSIASTVVLMRALQDRRILDTDRGRVVAGWLIVQDLLMVLALILLPTLAALLRPDSGGAALPLNAEAVATAVGITFAKVAAFIAIMLLVGRRAIPALLHYVAHTGSRELFRLAVLAVALGVAFAAAELFSVSFALGAFFAGMILNESELSQRAAEESLPLRDAFAALFFLSVGMLFDPMVIVREPLPLLATLLVVLVGNAGVAFLIVRVFRYPLETALTVGVGLAQIGEFSFILADLGVGLGVMNERARDLILGASILSILLNPVLFALKDRLKVYLEKPGAAAVAVQPEPALPVSTLTGHVILVGYGRVGSLVGEALQRDHRPMFVIDDAVTTVDLLKVAGVEALTGNAARPELLVAANVRQARLLIVAIPNGFEAGHIIQQARLANPDIEIITRAHYDAEVEQLSKLGANRVIMGEREIARAMIEEVRSDSPIGGGAAPVTSA
jgi:CPA2 family monovalent cation:H+ antiporter-2